MVHIFLFPCEHTCKTKFTMDIYLLHLVGNVVTPCYFRIFCTLRICFERHFDALHFYTVPFRSKLNVYTNSYILKLVYRHSFGIFCICFCVKKVVCDKHLKQNTLIVDVLLLSVCDHLHAARHGYSRKKEIGGFYS